MQRPPGLCTVKKSFQIGRLFLQGQKNALLLESHIEGVLSQLVHSGSGSSGYLQQIPHKGPDPSAQRWWISRNKTRRRESERSDQRKINDLFLWKMHKTWLVWPRYPGALRLLSSLLFAAAPLNQAGRLFLWKFSCGTKRGGSWGSQFS